MVLIGLNKLLLGIGLIGAVASCDGTNTGGQLNNGGAAGTYPPTANGGSSGMAAARCATCGSSKCPTEAKACSDRPVCKQLVDCSVNCAAGDAACTSGCTTAAANDSAAITTAATYLACITVQCTSDCFSSVGIGGAGSGTTNAGGSANGTSAGGSRATGGNVATGGTSTVTYRCEGTNAVTACATCGGTNPSCNCFKLSGCSGTTNFTCTGTPTVDCTQYDSFVECETEGCSVDYSESSPNLCMTPTCASLANNAKCGTLPGCKVASSSVTCTGTPTPCSGLTGQRCTDTQGCKWVAVQ